MSDTEQSLVLELGADRLLYTRVGLEVNACGRLTAKESDGERSEKTDKAEGKLTRERRPSHL